MEEEKLEEKTVYEIIWIIAEICDWAHDWWWK
jgi:hypothetical protein